MATFTVGHARILDRMELHEINNGAEALLFALVCRFKSASEIERWLASRLLPYRLVYWTNRRRGLIGNAEQVNAAVKVIGEYLEANTRVPGYFSKSDGKGELSTPFCQHLRVVLISKLGYSPESVDDTPYLQAMWDYLSFMELEGHIEINGGLKDEHEEAIMRHAEEILRKVQSGEIKA